VILSIKSYRIKRSYQDTVRKIAIQYIKCDVLLWIAHLEQCGSRIAVIVGLPDFVDLISTILEAWTM